MPAPGTSATWWWPDMAAGSPAVCPRASSWIRPRGASTSTAAAPIRAATTFTRPAGDHAALYCRRASPHEDVLDADRAAHRPACAMEARSHAVVTAPAPGLMAGACGGAATTVRAPPGVEGVARWPAVRPCT